MRLTTQITKRFEVPNDPDGSFIEVKNLTADTIESIRSRHNTTKIVDGVVEHEVNAYAVQKDIAKACLSDWGKFFDESGRPLKFTPANIAKVGQFVIAIEDEKQSFFSWVFECHQDLADEVEEESEVAAGN